MSKFEKLLDLLVNEQKDEAEKVFHEIVVEKSRQIYEGILAEEEETSEADESSDKAEGDEVDEAKDESTDSEDKVEETADEEEVEETEEPAESTDETIEEIGGDATDDLISDIEAEADGMDMEMPGEEGDEEGEDEGEEGEAEEMFEPLEKELDALKAEFAKMMDDDKEEAPEESYTESKDADSIVKEYAEMVKSGHGAEKMGKEAGADQKKSPVPSKNKPVNDAKAHAMGVGAEEKGGVGKALAGDTAKPMGKSFKNEGGIKSAKMDNAPKATEKEGSVDGKSPVASK